MSYIDEIVDGTDCKEHKFHTRTWTAIDDCGLVATATQVIEVVDLKAPLIDDLFDVAATCYDDTMFPLPTFTDCSEVEITFNDWVSSDVCLSGIRRTWILTDACGNVSTAIQYGIVTDDQAPAFGLLPSDVTVTSAVYATWQAPSVGASDNCQSVDVVGPEVTPNPQGNDLESYLYTWTAIDACGNSTSVSQAVTIDDNLGLGSAGNTPNLWVNNTAFKQSLKAYPNPVSNGFLQVDFTAPKEQATSLTIVNVLGQVVLSVEIDSVGGENNHQFDMSNLANGTYLLQLEVGETMLTKKIVKMD